MVNLGELERAVGLAIGYTLWIPSRFGRFADEVARLSKDPVDKKELKKQLEAALSQIWARNWLGMQSLRATRSTISKKASAGWMRSIVSEIRCSLRTFCSWTETTKKT